MSETTRPQINASKLAIGGGIAGAAFTIGSMLIFLTGLPTLRYMFAAALILGCGIALFLRLVRHKTPGALWLLSATEKGAEVPFKQDLEKNQNAPQRLAAIYMTT
jgi:sugar phosphate permease